MIPRNRIRNTGISTFVELEPKEFQMMIIPHSSLFTNDHLKNLVPPQSVLISHQCRIGQLENRILDLMNTDKKLNYQVQQFIHHDDPNKQPGDLIKEEF